MRVALKENMTHVGDLPKNENLFEKNMLHVVDENHDEKEEGGSWEQEGKESHMRSLR